MAYTLSTNLKLRLDSNLTANAKYNLERIDDLGGLTTLTTSGTLQIRAKSNLELSANDPAVGGVGSGGTISFATPGAPLDTFRVDADNIIFSGPVGFVDQAPGTTSPSSLSFAYVSTLSGNLDPKNVVLRLDLDNQDRELILGGNLRTSGHFSFSTDTSSSVLFPATGTLATLQNTETFQNKTIDLGTNTLLNLTPASLHKDFQLPGSKIDPDFSDKEVQVSSLSFSASQYKTTIAQHIDSQDKDLTFYLPLEEGEEGQVLGTAGQGRLTWVSKEEGPQGPAGPQGEKGEPGSTGFIGPAGATGPQGALGPIGPTGEKGDIGPAGPEGLQGLAGETGPPGPRGDKGPKGDAGSAGQKGATGPQGLQGLVGPAGETGPQGEQGPAGVAGPAGPKGDKGDTGSTGDTGPAGVDGAKGDRGEPGPIGLTGPQGEIGPIGPEGPVGAEGPVGPKGDIGPAGLPGATGPIGPSGETGAQGPQGIQGSKGDQGDIGPIGPQGLPGIQGIAGSNGLDGIDGKDGQDGQDGSTGPIGPIGPIGPAGATGATGPQGPAGPKGDAGAAGSNGLNGLDGIIGKDGKDGPIGPTGLTGPVGPVGPAGADGAKGDTGEAGPIGPQGIQGLSGLKGDKGDRGDRGAPGTSGSGGGMYSLHATWYPADGNEFTVSHIFNTRLLITQLFDNARYENVLGPSISRIDNHTVKLTTTILPPPEGWTILIQSIVLPSAHAEWHPEDGAELVINHNFGTRLLLSQLFDNVSYETIDGPTVRRVDFNTVKLIADRPPPPGGWTVLLHAIA